MLAHKNRPKAIVFDIGGVLLNINWKRVVAALDVEAHERYIQWIQHWPLHHQYEKGLQPCQAFFQQFKTYWELEHDLASLEAAWNEIFIGPIDGIETILDQLPPSLPKYVLSNTNPAHIRFCRKNYTLLDRFDRLFLSYEWQARKPEAKFYQAMLQAIHLVPEDVLFLDDSQENIEAARKLGIQAELTVHSAQQTQLILEQYLNF